jgi:hypothetical protein
MRRSSSSSIATLFFCVSPDRDRKGTRCFFFSKRPASLQVMTFVVLLSKTRFFLCFFHFRPSWNLIVENKKRGGEISTSMDKKKTKKKQKKRHVKKSDQKNRHKIIVAFDMRTTLHFGRGGFGDGKRRRRRRCDDTRARRC